MKETVAHFDCQFGAAGDMLLAALLDTGLFDHNDWLEAVLKIALPANSFSISMSKVERCSLKANKIDIACAEQASERHLSEILEVIERSEIASGAKELARRIFQRLGRAESHVHGIPIEEVHFHEVGAIDSIVDIIGFAIAYDLCQIKKATVSAVPLGTGTVLTKHGNLPVPAPAVQKLVADSQAAISNFSIPYECLTPTGAAILCEIANGWGAPLGFEKVLGAGSGAGTKDSQHWPNVCRVMIGIAQDSHASRRFREEQIAVVEANIDDQSPQAISYAVDRLWQAGALDVTVSPCLMKKGRSGHALSVICDPSNATLIQELLLTHTTTIGARVQFMNRLVAERNFVDVTVDQGTNVKVKIATDSGGNVLNVHPEFDDLAAMATARNISIKEAHQLVMNRYEEQTKTGSSSVRIPFERVGCEGDIMGTES